MARKNSCSSDGADRSIREHWPHAYARWRASKVGTLTDRLERDLILDLLAEVGGRDVLDVGCGDGGLAVKLSSRGARVTGVDASQMMIGAACARVRALGANAAFTVARAEELPFASHCFDVVAAVTILCFVDDATGAFGEMVRVLRPGGRLVIGELGKWSPWAAARRIRGWLGSSIWRSGRFRTAHELRTLAEETGLVVESVRGAIHYPRVNVLARLMAPVDSWIGKRSTMGAALIVLRALKPEYAAARSGVGRRDAAGSTR